MLSILVPVYNFNVTSLVRALSDQCRELPVDYEIRCYDDGSDLSWREENRSLVGLANVEYRELGVNRGRSAIRNLLGAEAKYAYLLFMDCDSKVVSADYVSKYVQQLTPEGLLYGGRVYQESPPAEVDYRLHWLFGRHREQIPASERSKRPYDSFMTNNFVIPHAIFQDIRFDERLTQYGHEDTLFGMELERRQIPILHLENALEHVGLESAETFLAKTDQAIQNLKFLRESGVGIRTKLLKATDQLQRLKAAKVVKYSLRPFFPLIRKSLLSANPKIRNLDVYKLGKFLGL